MLHKLMWTRELLDIELRDIDVVNVDLYVPQTKGYRLKAHLIVDVGLGGSNFGE